MCAVHNLAKLFRSGQAGRVMGSTRAAGGSVMEALARHVQAQIDRATLPVQVFRSAAGRIPVLAAITDAHS